MATSPSVFPFAHIALTAAITAGVALLVLVVLRPRYKMLSLVDCLLVAVVVGISVIVWRSAGNTAALNNDPIPPVSPNDVLCPLVTYLFIGFYAAFRPPLDATRFERKARAESPEPTEPLLDRYLAASAALADAAQANASAQGEAVAQLRAALKNGDNPAVYAAVDAMWKAFHAMYTRLQTTEVAWNQVATLAAPE